MLTTHARAGSSARRRLSLLLVLSGWPAALASQTIVKVADATGAPIPSAHVELWSATMRVAARVTDNSGIARFTSEDRARSDAVIARRIGFRPGRLLIAGRTDTLLVRMEAFRGSLPAVTVAATRQACPNMETPEAVQRWRAAVSQYQSPSTVGRKADVEGRRATVSERDVGTIDAGAPPTTGWRLYTLAGMAGARSGLAQGGYVRPLTGSHSYDDFGTWRYPPLHAELAGHFADPSFAEQHTMSLRPPSGQTTVIEFCVRDRTRSGLNGSLRLDASGALLDARWTYWNPVRGAEQAGGEVVFAPPSRSGLGPLFSASGLFWRRLPSGMYLQSWQRYSEWQLLPDTLGTSSAGRRLAP